MGLDHSRNRFQLRALVGALLYHVSTVDDVAECHLYRSAEACIVDSRLLHRKHSCRKDLGMSSADVQRPEKRASRACVTCRKRKSQCNLLVINGVATTPCERCKATGQQCVIATSMRGGRRVRKHKPQTNDASTTDLAANRTAADAFDSVYESIEDSSTHTAILDSGILPSPAQTNQNVQHSTVRSVSFDLPEQQQPQQQHGQRPMQNVGGCASNGVTRESSVELQNPSDAVHYLARIASHEQQYRTGNEAHPQYYLIRTGQLSLARISGLLDRYKQRYHPYWPIVPPTTLSIARFEETAKYEPALLTAVLTIASRDLTDDPRTFSACTEHMKSLVSELSAGGPCDVSSVEALLLLAEWAPYTSRSNSGSVGRGEEDREAWMHVGIALRMAYFLGLDRYSFNVRDTAKDAQWQRKRLAWTACYISDRQISIRLGRAFWSRGPGPLTTLRKEDFPMLAPVAAGNEDFASIFQATLEHTMLFGNVHDLLYSNHDNSMRSHLSGGYIRYIDDFRTAIYGWKSIWGSLTCSPPLKATLMMSYDYLRLYTTSFAFHATVKRAASQIDPAENRRHPQRTPGRIFYNNISAIGDARFIYEALDAAKSVLSMVNTFVDPEESLRFMPLRFYLYSVHCAVFLYRAYCVGVLAPGEEQAVRAMVQVTIDRLQRSASGVQHPGSRYSRLLKLLWDKVERTRHGSPHHAATPQDPYRPGANAETAVLPPPAAPMMSTGDLADFSWTDLDSIGAYVVDGASGTIGDETDWWSGFLPTDSQNFMFSDMPEFDSSRQGVL